MPACIPAGEKQTATNPYGLSTKIVDALGITLCIKQTLVRYEPLIADCLIFGLKNECDFISLHGLVTVRGSPAIYRIQGSGEGGD